MPRIDFCRFLCLFVNITVDAVDYIVTCRGVPRTALADRIPLFQCAVKGDARKCGATVKRSFAYVLHSIGDCDARKPGATVERKSANARHAAIVGYFTVLAPCNKCL